MRVVWKWLVSLTGLALAVSILLRLNHIAPSLQMLPTPRFFAQPFAYPGSAAAHMRGTPNLLYDPALVYSTFLGGPNGSRTLQQATALIVDATGNVYVAGNTTSATFPTTAGVVQPSSSPNLNGTFVSKIDPTGKTLIFSTYVPGIVELDALALDASGEIYIAGLAGSLPIPAGTTPFQGAQRSIGLIKLNQTATAVLNATYLGGSGRDFVSGIAVDAAGSLYVTGPTLSNDFPTLNPLQGSLGTSGSNAFVTKLDSSLSTLAYSTYLGGNSNSGSTTFGSIAVDSSMNAYVVGSATSGFPTTSAAIKTTCASACAFLSKLNPSGASLLYSTYLGEQSSASTVVVDTAQNAYVGGMTTSGISPLDSCSTGFNGFVAEINAAGAVPFSACLGNLQLQFDHGVSSLTRDSSGNLYVAGSGAAGLTLKNPIQTNSSPNPIVTSYVAAINPNTNSLLFSSLIGGAQPLEADTVTAIGVDSKGNIYAAGAAWSGALTSSVPPPFPVFNAIQAEPGVPIPCTNCVTSDAFILKIAPTNAPAAALNPARLLFPTQAVGTSSSPQAVTIFDLGSAPLTVSNVTVTGDFSIQNACGTVAPAGGSCTINVTFSPATAGTQSGILTITDDSAGSPRTVQLIGQGGQGTAEISPASLSFPNQVVGTTSPAQQVTLTNGGSLALQVSHIQTVNPFSETNTCGTSVAAGGSCTISITFSPSVAGAATGSLTITDSAPNSPQTVPLTGTGTSPSLGLSVASGGSGSATVTAGASATYMLSIGGAGMSGTASLSCTGAPAGAACSLPSTLSVSGASASSFNVSVTTTARSQGWFNPLGPTPWLWALAILGCLVLLKAASGQQSNRLRWRFVPLLAVVLCACGGGSSTAPSPTATGTPAGTYALTVTATSGSTTQTQNLTLTVQ